MSLERAALTLVTLALVGLLYLLMLAGWRSRQRRQSDLPPPPAAPADRGSLLFPATPGLFVGTTFAGDWLDRVAVHDLGHRAAGWLVVTTDGVHVERDGLPDLYLPYSCLAQATTGEALAGKVIGRNGLLLLDWQLGDRLLTSGFRADDHDAHQRVAEAITSRLPAAVTLPDQPDPAQPKEVRS